MQKLLYICRGLPGSGKTTLANILAKDHAYAADDFFEKGGVYKFNPTLLGEAHSYCQSRVKDDMTAGVPVIAVHNTFSSKWEAEPYFSLAKKFCYSVFVIEAQNEFGNIHSVPVTTIEAMRNRWAKLS